jgi:hypothetical protein
MFFFVISNAQKQELRISLKMNNENTEQQKQNIIQHKNLQPVFEEYSISEIRQVFPYSKNDTLKRLYKIECTEKEATPDFDIGCRSDF